MKLEDIYPKYSMPDAGGDKGTLHSYIPVYSAEISPNVGSLLEIGVWQGHSLAMWEEYLPHALIVGMDTTLHRVKFDVNVVQGDATKPAAVEQLFEGSEWDVIIDDGSHRVDDQLASFELLWPKVSIGGKYFIEDIAGPGSLALIERTLSYRQLDYRVWDLRDVKGRFDDILVMVTKC